MNIVSMMDEILIVSNPVVRESALPDFSSPTEDFAKSVRVSAFDKLDGVFECHTVRGL